MKLQLFVSRKLIESSSGLSIEPPTLADFGKVEVAREEKTVELLLFDERGGSGDGPINGSICSIIRVPWTIDTAYQNAVGAKIQLAPYLFAIEAAKSRVGDFRA